MFAMAALILLSVFNLLIAVNCQRIPCDDVDCYKSAPELILSRGFDYEFYRVTTTDGYILGLFRIVHPQSSSETGSKYPIILTNAFATGVNGWMWHPGGHAENIKDPKHVDHNSRLNGNLAFELANHGYDVWLFNSRGSTFSMNHTTLDPESREFFKFSYNEIGLYDLPAVIKRIRINSKSRTVGYVGYSDATVRMYILLATKPRFNDILKPVILLAPAARYSDIRTVLGTIPGVVDLFKSVPMQVAGELEPNPLVLLANPPLTVFTAILLEALLGFDIQQLNTTRLKVYASQIGKRRY